MYETDTFGGCFVRSDGSKLVNTYVARKRKTKTTSVASARFTSRVKGIMANNNSLAASEWCLQRLRRHNLDSSLLKIWSCQGVATAGIYVWHLKKGSNKYDQIPAMLEAYVGFCATFDKVYGGDKIEQGLSGDHLKYKRLNLLEVNVRQKLLVAKNCCESTRSCGHGTRTFSCPHGWLSSMLMVLSRPGRVWMISC
jgi:hypothetical protein